MNAKMKATLKGIEGRVLFDNGNVSKAVKTADGTVYVQSVNPNLYLPCTDEAAELFITESEWMA